MKVDTITKKVRIGKKSKYINTFEQHKKLYSYIPCGKNGCR